MKNPLFTAIFIFIFTIVLIFVVISKPIVRRTTETSPYLQELNSIIDNNINNIHNNGFSLINKAKVASNITYLNLKFEDIVNEIQSNIDYVLKTRIPLPKLPDFLAIYSHEDDFLENPNSLRTNNDNIPTYEEAVDLLKSLNFPEVEKKLNYRTLYEVLNDWNPDEINIPTSFKETIYHLDYGNPLERGLSVLFRQAELPFKIFNVSSIITPSLKWNDQYLLENIEKDRSSRSIVVHTEESKDNHFLFWKLTNKQYSKEYNPPTKIVKDVDFEKYLELAKKAKYYDTINFPHHYYMIGSSPGRNTKNFITNDLKIFSSSNPTYFVTNPKKNKGIQCRISMDGVIAESHYDSGKNMVAMFRGKKRYIINPPRTCDRLSIINSAQHPSFRHSIKDWSDKNQIQGWKKYDDLSSIDTVVRMGEVLYIPSFWFHYIISLDFSIQCNTRSGFPDNMIGNSEIKSCFNRIQVE